MSTLAAWSEQQYRRSIAGMLQSFGPLAIVKERAGFGQHMRALPGAVVASPVPGAYDPDPDYFFHWYRDSALVIDALRLASVHDGEPTDAWSRCQQFVHFSLALGELDGRRLVRNPAWRAAVAPAFHQYLRPDEDLGAAHGAAVAGETRVNPDGTLDISRWPRPQHDGPALRALTLLRWLRGAPVDESTEAMQRLLRADLAYVLGHWHTPCYDIWEEELGSHYYPLRVGAAALLAGADWLQTRGETGAARDCRAQGEAALERLEAFWDAEAGYFRSRGSGAPSPPDKALDISVIMAALHSADAGDAAAHAGAAAHSVRDPRMLATLEALAGLFGACYPINRDLPAHRAPALGRYAGDRYFSGGAYYFSTLAAAEFCYRAAAGSATPAALRARGDGFLETVRLYTPADGELAEQFDQRDGAQSSAKKLAWSHAALISCVVAGGAPPPPAGRGGARTTITPP